MRVWHVDARGDHTVVDGINMGLWRLAAAQAEQADVTLLCRTPVSPDSQALAAAAGFVAREHAPGVRPDRTAIFGRSVPDPGRPEPGRPDLGRPDVVNLHGSWSPYLAAAAWRLRRAGVPYVLTPHGGHNPSLRSEGRWKRLPYLHLVERPTAFGADRLVYAIEEEAADAADLYGRAPDPDRVRIVPFPCPCDTAAPSWAPPASPRVVTLGRFDVFQKGVDGLVELARRLPHVRFDCHGNPPDAPDARARFEAVASTAPPNVGFLAPVHGDAKHDAITTATVYLQYSRFEGFSLSVTEAMAAGVPVVVADRLRFSARLGRDGVLVPISSDPAVGAAELDRLVGDPAALAPVAAAGLAYVTPRLDDRAIGDAYLALYDDVRRAHRS